MVKHTPLMRTHVAMGAWMDEFAGWEMPIRYTDIPREHRAVREAAGLFDVSHMGQLRVRGEGAFAFVESLVTNAIAAPSRHRATYSPMCHANGGTVDDLFVYALSDRELLLVVNAGNIQKDEVHIRALLPKHLLLKNESPEWIQLAIQGPAAPRILQQVPELSSWNPAAMPFMGWQTGMLSGFTALLSRSGYTGGDGYELYLHCGDSVETADDWWQRFLRIGAPYGLVPVGLGARDTLRLEGALPLYGHELTDSLSPVAAGLDRFIKPSKGEFLGREALVQQLTQGTEHVRVGLEMVERGIPREGCAVYAGTAGAGSLAGDNATAGAGGMARDISGDISGALSGPNGGTAPEQPIGWVSSGGVGIWVEKHIAMAYVPPAWAAPDTVLLVEVRGRRLKARVVPLPFYRKPQAP